MWMTVISEIFKGFGRYYESQALQEQLRKKEAMADYNAKRAKADAVAAQKKTDFDQIMQSINADAIMGSMKAGMSMSGGRPNFAVMSSQYDHLQLDNFLVGLEGRTRKTRFESEAVLHEQQGDLYDDAADQVWLQYHLGEGAYGFGKGGSMGMGNEQSANYSTASSAGYQSYGGGRQGGSGSSGYGYGSYGSYGSSKGREVAVLGRR